MEVFVVGVWVFGVGFGVVFVNGVVVVVVEEGVGCFVEDVVVFFFKGWVMVVRGGVMF